MFFEALKITILCLVVATLAYLFAQDNRQILVFFNMAVMSCAATFSPWRRELRHLLLGGTVIVLSTIGGSLIAHYSLLVARLLTILYAGLALSLPKTQRQSIIFSIGATVFLIFTAFPASPGQGLPYLIGGVGVVALLFLFHLLFERTKPTLHTTPPWQAPSTLVGVLSLSLAWLAAYLLSRYTSLDHLFWVALTALVVVQGSHQKTISTSLTRILVNIAGALISVLLFGYLLPDLFLPQFALLSLFLFLIFYLGASYMWRTLFIELFVLGFTHLLGAYHDSLALDRVILTLIGGGLVILVTLIAIPLTRNLSNGA